MKKHELDINIIKKLNSDGLRPSQIAKIVGSHPKRIKEELSLTGIDYNKYTRIKKCNNHLIPKIIELINKGYSKSKIAKELNTYKSLILSICNENNIAQLTPDGHKKCYKCKELKIKQCFQKSKRSKDGLRGICSECRRDEPVNKNYQYLYRIKNKERKRYLDKEYRDKNALKIKEYRSSDKYKEVKSRSDKKYYSKNISNPVFKISRVMRSTISSKVRNKDGKTFDILGYSSVDLCNHLESKFKDGMNWDNYGRNGWHIDHIRPLASFDFDNKDWIKEAFSLNNLQPLWESENCSKGSLYNGVRYSKFKK